MWQTASREPYRTIARHYCFFKCPRELTLGRDTKTDISCEWNTKFSIIPEIPSKRVHSKRILKFLKTFPGIFTVPFNFGPEISEFLALGRNFVHFFFLLRDFGTPGQKTAALFLAWDDTVYSIQVFTVVNFGLITFIVPETNVIPSHVLLSFAA